MICGDLWYDTNVLDLTIVRFVFWKPSY